MHAVLKEAKEAKEAYDVMNTISNQLKAEHEEKINLNRKLEAVNEKLFHLATIDELTNLPNR